jgi:dTDP-4-amino-4,6-dideoxygalactose transaminase
MRLIRNHAESVVGSTEEVNLTNMIGYNFRLGEIEAAMASTQLSRLEKTVQSRIDSAVSIIKELKNLKGLVFPSDDYISNSVFYMIPIRLNNDLPWNRNKIIDALRAEGVPALIEGYTNIHKLPIFTRKVAYGTHMNPWKSGSGTDALMVPSCPVAEELYSTSFFGIHMCTFEFNAQEVELFVAAFHKVWNYMLEESK